MDRGFFSGVLFGLTLFRRVAEIAVDALRMPRRQILLVSQTSEEIADVRIGRRVGLQNGIVEIPGLLLPWIKKRLSPTCDWD